MPQKDQKCFHKLNAHVQHHANEMFERHSGRKERDNIENSVELKEKLFSEDKTEAEQNRSPENVGSL